MRFANVLATSPALALALLALAACARPSPCEPAPLTLSAERSLEEHGARIDFPVLAPCSPRSDTRVDAVYLDMVSGQPRLSLSLSRAGERAYLLSQSRAEIEFRAIPLSSRPLTVESASVSARGFAGPSMSGGDLAYLRWRCHGVTYEVQAAVLPWFGERELRGTASELMSASRALGGGDCAEGATTAGG